MKKCLKSRSNGDRTTECECGNIAWKMEKILEENQLLEKHYCMILAALINKDYWEFDSFKMCRGLDGITITEDGQIIVRFFEGTEVEL